MNQFHLRGFKQFRSLRSLALVSILLGALLLALGTYTAATAADDPEKAQPVQQAAPFDLPAALLLGTAPSPLAGVPASLPQPAQDPCLHCHIAGENRNLTTPLLRWSLFGLAGLVFAFGFYKTTSVWLTRSPWKPLTARTVDWVDERYQLKQPMEKILKKPVPKYALRWFYCLGGMTAFLFVVQAVTGIMLAFYYKPTADQAYASIQFIESEVVFGASIRAIHHWAANGMIVMVIAHMLRVFIMGVYKPPRELNWVNGVLLFIMTLAFGFTGYLLPWDQRAFWATTVGSEIAGSIPIIGEIALIFLRVGWAVTDLTLGRFYALHVIILPVLTIAFMGLHFLMIRRQGIAQPL